MDQGSLSLSVYVMMACLLAAVGNKNCTCPTIKQQKDTKVPPVRCFAVGDRFRYSCTEGKLRKAGTSNLIICKENNGLVEWTTYNLECIDDPSPRPPKSTVTDPETVTSHQTTAKADYTSASAAAEASNSTADRENDPNKHINGSESRGKTTMVGIPIVSLLIICASVGGSLYFCKRRNKEKPVEVSEEQVPMNVSP